MKVIKDIKLLPNFNHNYNNFSRSFFCNIFQIAKNYFINYLVELKF